MAAGGQRRNRFLRPWLAVFGLAVVSSVLSVLPDPASAQELIRRQTFFDRLFGGPPPREALPPPPRQRRVVRPRRGAPVAREQRARRSAPAARSTRRAAAEPKPAPVVEKSEDARVVLVVGDFLASGLAEGLEAAYADAPGVRVVDRSNGSSGFVRDDYYDWNGEIGGIVEEVKPAVVVVMIGSNDRQQLNVNGESERPQTEAWRTEYARRATAFANSVKSAGVPLVWTGVPSFKSPSMSSDMLAFNDIYKQAAESAGGTFVDIWEGFVDENGAFLSTGPDMNGQPVRLRSSDGINLTEAGKRKVAFYVEKPVSKILGTAVSPDSGQPGVAAAPQPGVASATPLDLTRTQPISLAGPELDGGSELLGGAPPPAASPDPEPKPKPGRADDFSLRQPAPSNAAADRETTTAIRP
ncbi:DUF459 domain-containing protein [Chelativorans sp.]|uniref:SGNH/GDSL hydrolase family protein n=1 Tax=Chelativorans sp. TaxID=2203393 RepID=UPI002812290E|nr:DUF459 domain-containing protein [Chelativorans sp.]